MASDEPASKSGDDRVLATDGDRGNWHLTERVEHELGRGDPFAAAVRTTRMPMALSDPRQPDNPLVFVNRAFQDLVGYEREEILGRNCRFLQGPETSKESVDIIRQGIRDKRPVHVELLNYRKDGSTFWNALQMGPVFGDDGEVDFFFASQIDITDRIETEQVVSRQEAIIEREVARRTKEQREALERQQLLTHEVDHRVKNNLAMISSLVRLETRATEAKDCREVLERVQGRVDAMAAVHRQLSDTGNGETFELGKYAAELAQKMVANFARDDVQLKLDIDQGIEVDVVKGAPFGLLLNEMVTNALKHAYADQGGVLTVGAKDRGDHVLFTVSDDGPGMDLNVPRGQSIGSRLTEGLATQLGGTKRLKRDGPGTTFEIEIPKR